MAIRPVSVKPATELLRKANLVIGESDKFSLIGAPRELVFPTLNYLANQFSRMNKFKINKSAEYALPERILPEDYERGLILSLNGGLVVLAYRPTIRGPDNLEPAMGHCSPIESYAVRYILSGELKGKNTNLVMNVIYSRHTKQEAVEDPISHRKKLVDVPYGEFKKHIWREDRERYWFLSNQANL
jgi:hypothetical protein